MFFIILIQVLPQIQGHSFISQLFHVTHAQKDILRYAGATVDQALDFYLRYGTHDLTLRLFPRGHVDALTTPLLDSHPGHSLYTGYVIGDARSEVVGHFIRGGVFSGVIYTSNRVIHVEPSTRHGNFSSHNVVYHRSDVNVTSSLPFLKSATADGWFKVKKENPATTPPPDNGFKYSKRSTAGGGGGAFPRRRKTCPVYLVSDQLFYRQMGGGDETSTQNELILHLHEADKIFRSTDFNEDGTNDNIGFSVANVSILKENTAENKFSDESIEVKDFLDRWSEYNHDQYCLAVLFTYRDFDSGVLGLAWVASVDGAPGGICQKRQAVAGYNRNLNTAIVSLINFGRYVGHAVSFITVAHELGHNFGSSHDEDNYRCSPGLQRNGGGNYIMYARATDGNLPNNVKFSDCSKRAITRVLTVKSSCFQTETSYCGNKIKEWDEVCDCGNSETCAAVDHCCTPRSPSSQGCVLKSSSLASRYSSSTYQCSPQQGSCCADNCSFKPKSANCEGEAECRHSSYCNGSSGVCPDAPYKDLAMCNDGSNTCQEGECKGSVCRLVGLPECQCEGEELCTVCCLEEGTCRPTGQLTQHSIERTYLASGRSCNNFNGYCNADHMCIQVNLQNPITTLDDIFSRKNLGNVFSWMTRHWYYTLSIFCGIIVVLFLLRVTYRRSAPMQRYMAHISQTLRRGGGPQSKTSGGSQYHQHTPGLFSAEEQEKLSRMCAMFPTASRSVLWDVRREAIHEEAAVIKMLDLGFPFKPNSL